MRISSENDLKLKEHLIKRVPLYVQSKETTCGAALSLIVLNYYFGNRFPLNSKTEMDIFNKIKFKEYEYGNLCKIADLFAGYGLDTKIVIHGPNLDHPLFKTKTFKQLISEYQTCKKKLIKDGKVRVVDKDFSIFDIMSDLSDGYLVIAEIKYPTEELTHTILLRGFRGNKIYYIDPLDKNGGCKCYYKKLEALLDFKTLKNYLAVKGLERKVL